MNSNRRQAVTDQLHRAQRKLPHWQLGGSTYFVTYCCVDGVVLANAERTLVLENWKYWHGKRYLLHAVVVMPDHVHILAMPVKKNREVWFGLDEILQTNKGYTAHEINKLTLRTGNVWQGDRFDRIVRDETEFWEKWSYMANNPVKAGLSLGPDEYPWWWYSKG